MVLRRIIVALFQIAVVANCACLANAGGASKATVNRPNIIIILADDFGWGDASCNYPTTPLKTPAIDRLAKEGIRLTNAHAPSSVCTPTRYGLLTGRYPWRSYLKKGVLAFYAPAMITKDRTTIASYLKSLGYRTGGFGKWHLGLDWTPIAGDPANWRAHWQTRVFAEAMKVQNGIDHTRPFKNGPIDVGFDTFFGTPSNCSRLPFFIADDRVYGTLERDRKGNCGTRPARETSLTTSTSTRRYISWKTTERITERARSSSTCRSMPSMPRSWRQRESSARPA